MACVTLTTVDVNAQDHDRFDVAAGYSLVHVNNQAGTFPKGWFVSGSVCVYEWLSLVADFSAAYKSYDTVISIPGPVTGHNVSLLAGPRLRYVVRGHASVFGQVLFGSRCSGTRAPTSDLHGRFFVWQPGIGVDVPLNPMWAIRLEADLRILPDRFTSPKYERILIGVAFKHQR